MFYVRDMNKDGVDVINSKTLEMKNYSYAELFKAVINGLKVYRLCTLFCDPDGRDIDLLSPTSVRRFSGFVFLDKTYLFDNRNFNDFRGTFLNYSAKIPLEKCIDILDFSVNQSDIIIHQDKNICHIWYRGFYTKITTMTLQGFYRDGDLIYLDDKFNRSGKVIRYSVPLTGLEYQVPCSRSEFQRLVLFR